MRYKYKSYSEIPENITGYMKKVTGSYKLADVPLEDINDFLNGLESYYQEQEKQLNNELQEIQNI